MSDLPSPRPTLFIYTHRLPSTAPECKLRRDINLRLATNRHGGNAWLAGCYPRTSGVYAYEAPGGTAEDFLHGAQELWSISDIRASRRINQYPFSQFYRRGRAFPSRVARGDTDAVIKYNVFETMCPSIGYKLGCQSESTSTGYLGTDL